jgi:hypothetical protein
MPRAYWWDLHGHGAVDVGAVDTCPGPLQRGHHVRVRVAVVVVPARADQRVPGPDRGEERRVGGAAAVVRDLEQARAQPTGRRQQSLLGDVLGVAGEQRAPVAVVDAQDQ